MSQPQASAAGLPGEPRTETRGASFENLMQDAQWRAGPPGVWTKTVRQGAVQLVRLGSSSVYAELELRGCSALRTTAGKHLVANGTLAGPAKFTLLRGRRRPVCRIVLPPYAAEFVHDPGRELDDPQQFADWIAAWDSLTTGTAPDPLAQFDYQAAAAHLNARGWNAEAGPDKAIVHVQRRGLYSQITLGTCPYGGRYVGADLIQLAGIPASARRAASRVASVANRRLAMPRFSGVREGAAMKLRCEVHLGFGVVTSEWLLAAIEAVEAGVVLTVRELQAAVRDTALADLVVAAPAA